MELKICHLYPDVLNLYGDRGNIMCLAKRLEWRGIEANISRVAIGEAASLKGYDLIFMGGGQDFEQQVLMDDLKRGRAADIVAAVEDGICFLAICGGFRMLGTHCVSATGEKSELIGAIDMHTVMSANRMIGDYKFRCADDCGGSIAVGFENHAGKTYLGKNISPLGTVLCGHGNNGEDKTEGVHYKNVFGSYAHGPLLPKNPELCDFILKTALCRKYGSAELLPLDDSAELLAHDEMCAKL